MGGDESLPGINFHTADKQGRMSLSDTFAKSRKDGLYATEFMLYAAVSGIPIEQEIALNLGYRHALRGVTYF